MAQIRNDLVGVVYAYRATGETVVLSAGDDIPGDISIGSHLIGDTADEANTKPRTEVAENRPQNRRGRPKSSLVVNDATSNAK